MKNHHYLRILSIAIIALLVCGPAGATCELIEKRHQRSRGIFEISKTGWSFIGFSLVIGAAAINTGVNLLYLVLSLMLAFLVLSGVFSESALRGISVRRRLPRELHAGMTTSIGLEITNAQRRIPAFAVVVEDRVVGSDGVSVLDRLDH